MSFSRIKNLKNACKRLQYSQVLAGFFSHVIAENWQHLKDTLGVMPFRHFYVLESK